MKLFGGDGCEALLTRSDARACTGGAQAQQHRLLFVSGAPLLLHVTPGPPADVAVWDLRACALAASTLWPAADAVTSLTHLPRTPFALLGGDDGALTAACLTRNAVEPRDWSYTPPSGPPSPIVSVAPQPGAADGRLLLATSCGGVTLLDVASRKAVCTAHEEAGPRCVGALFVSDAVVATAHAHGAVRLWRLPDCAAPHKLPPPAPGALTLVAEWPLCDGDVADEGEPPLTEALFMVRPH